MKYKFKVGDLVEVISGVPGHPPPLLALVTDRTYYKASQHAKAADVYTLLLPDGSNYGEYGDKLTKAGE